MSLLKLELSQGPFFLGLWEIGDLSSPATTTSSNSNPHNSSNANSTSMSFNGPPSSSIMMLPATIKEESNRSILLVHVGKAGGMTLRQVAKLLCNRTMDPMNPARVVRRVCSGRNFPDQQTVPLTGKLIHDVFHIWAYNATMFPLVTTYLVTIRNPVERIISAFRYSHPTNCPMHLLEKGEKFNLPWGCQLYKQKGLYEPGTPAYTLFSTCFPLAAMEDFAQSLMSPWVHGPHWQANLTKPLQQWACRNMAQSIVKGMNEDLRLSMPHVHYNYRYYGEKTFLQYPQKDVLVIRTEHEWEDMSHLDQWLGGAGIMRNEQEQVSHGSSGYVPSPLSRQANQKLCCMLVDEMELYFIILDKALNLDADKKQESKNYVYQTCDIAVTNNDSSLPSWNDWKLACRQRLENDAKFLRKQKMATFLEMTVNKQRH